MATSLQLQLNSLTKLSLILTSQNYSHLTNGSKVNMTHGKPPIVIRESLGPAPRSAPNIVTLVPPSVGPDSGDTWRTEIQCEVRTVSSESHF